MNNINIFRRNSRMTEDTMLALAVAALSVSPKRLTPYQPTNLDKLQAEISAWNAAVAAKKRAKKGA